jgi:hypothetical protein
MVIWSSPNNLQRKERDSFLSRSRVLLGLRDLFHAISSAQTSLNRLFYICGNERHNIKHLPRSRRLLEKSFLEDRRGESRVNVGTQHGEVDSHLVMPIESTNMAPVKPSRR